MKTKNFESCVGNNGMNYALLRTHKRKRVDDIEKAINKWNDKEGSDGAKIQLHPGPFEDNIVTFTKKPGNAAEDHFIVQTIDEQERKRWDGTSRSTYKVQNFGKERCTQPQRSVSPASASSAAAGSSVQVVSNIVRPRCYYSTSNIVAPIVT
jgi:hypothetical protein